MIPTLSLVLHLWINREATGHLTRNGHRLGVRIWWPTWGIWMGEVQSDGR